MGAAGGCELVIAAMTKYLYNISVVEAVSK
jgi:hypothetical protein